MVGTALGLLGVVLLSINYIARPGVYRGQCEGCWKDLCLKEGGGTVVKQTRSRIQQIKLGASFRPQYNRQLAQELSTRSMPKGSHSSGSSSRRGSSSKPRKDLMLCSPRLKKWDRTWFPVLEQPLISFQTLLPLAQDPGVELTCVCLFWSSCFSEPRTGRYYKSKHQEVWISRRELLLTSSPPPTS